MNERFRVGITSDFLKADGTMAVGDIGLDLLSQDSRIEHEFLPDYGFELPLRAAADFDALLVLAPRVTHKTLAGSDRLAIVARFGVGYDNVDVSACSDNGVLFTITPSGVRRPVAVAALTYMLALAHKLLTKDRLTRTGRWDEKLDHIGIGLTGRTLGVIGLGNIGREILRIAAPLEMRYLAFDPFVAPEEALAAEAELVSLETLLSEATFVCVCCALTPQTRRLLDEVRLSMMKPSAYLINVARGPIVDQEALTRMLRDHRIAGAALDVFEREPIEPDDPLLSLDNVLLSPHAICWTDECFRGNGVAACQSILDVAAGRIPGDIVNREVLANDKFIMKLSGFLKAHEGQPR